MLSLNGLGSLAFLGLVLVAGISFVRTSIGGTLYRIVVAGKALETDVVPPSLFQAEPYLLCYQASREIDPGARDAMLARLDSLKVLYEARAKYWRGERFPDSMESVLQATLATSDRFWATLDSGFRPAMANVDLMSASIVVDQPLRQRFFEHRASALRLVGMAGEYAHLAERSALGSRSIMMAVTALVAILGLLVMGATFRVAGVLIGRVEVQRAASEHSQARTLVVDAKGVIVWESPASERYRDELGRFAPLPDSGPVGLEVHRLHPDPSALSKVLVEDLDLRVGTGATSSDSDADLFLVLTSRLRREGSGEVRGAVLTWEVQDARFGAERRAILAERLEDRAVRLHESVVLLESVGRSGVEQSSATQERCASIRTGSAVLESSIRSVASASEEMAASVQEMAKVSHLAALRAEESHAEATSTMAYLTKLHEEGSRISRAVGLIDTLAAQTRLLALNATIEAARAGEAGRGFAVVAQEVKDLSKTTAEANAQIAEVVQAMLRGLQDAESGIERISKAALEASDLQRTLAAGVEEQSTTTSEVARSISEAARRGTEMRAGMEILERLAVTGAEHARRIAAASDALREVSADLHAQVRGLRSQPGEA